MTLTAQQLTHNFVKVIALISCIFLTFLILNSIVCAVDKPTVFDHNLKLDIEYQGNDDPELRENQLSAVTQFRFLGDHDILLLNKNDGKVLRIQNHTLLSEPLLDVNVTNQWESGLLGIAVSKYTDKVYVFLYYTESMNGDVANSSLTDPSYNKLYRYQLLNNKLVNPKLIFRAPTSNRYSHIGGALQIGPDNNLYLAVGDMHGEHHLNLYYAYGIRNSFGLDFDPISGKLWDTENGPKSDDENNLVEPGHNGGWNKIQGLSLRNGLNENFSKSRRFMHGEPEGLVDFGGKGKYSAPEHVWSKVVAPTALKFLNSEQLGKKYQDDLFVASFNYGEIYDFDLSENRSKLEPSNISNNDNQPDKVEIKNVIFADGLGEITDIDVGPDGNLYVLSNYHETPTIFRISSVGGP